MPGDHILHEGNYMDPVTIETTNIKPGWATSPESGDMTDSVEFSTTVVLEFPAIAILPLAFVFAGMASLQCHRMRLRSR